VEKIIYPVWKKAGVDGDAFRDQLLQELAPALLADENIRALRLSVVDGAVVQADSKRMETCQAPLPDGLISIWVNDNGARQSLDEAIAEQVERFTAYLVTEAEPIVNTEHPPRTGERGYGFCQIVFLQRPARLSEAEWLEIWQGSHTRVAIDTQSTFTYRQNVIARTLSAGAFEFDAMIEENFPPEAMTSDHAFYNVSDDKALEVNMGAMMTSCARFIDFDKIDVIPMSEYVLKTL
jgi:hypothetical protein